MALDPKELYSEGWWDEKNPLPPGITPPSGVDWKTGNYYAHFRINKDGSRDIQWYQRGVGGGPGKPDPVMETTSDKLPASSDAVKEWEAAQAKDAAAPSTRVINGVPHQVVGKDANGQEIWAPVQTAAGPATAASTTTAQRQDWRSEGTQTGTDADGKPIYDNSRPVMAEYVNGKRTGATRAPTGDELKDWNAAQQMSRNPGGKTDADIAAEQKAADDKANVAADNRRADATQAQNAANQAQSAATAALNAATTAAREKRENELAGRIQDPTTKQWLEKDPTDGSWRPIKTEGVPSGALPADAPQPSGRLGEAAADLQAFDQYLNAQVRSVPPKMTTDQADKLREARRSFWATALSEQQGVVNTQKGVYDSENAARNATMADLSNRRSSATQIANQASSELMPLMTKMGPNAANGPSLAAAIRASRNNAMDFVTMSGANRMVPEVEKGPALTSVNGMPLPGGTAASPQMGPGFNPRGGPNALGFGVPGSVSPTGAQVAAGNAATQAALAPLLAPPPQVAASAAATPSAPQPAASAPSPASGGPADPRSIGAPEPPSTPMSSMPALPATPDAADPLLNMRNKRTGEIKQVRLSQINNASDKEDFEVLDPNGGPSVQPFGEPMIPQPVDQMPVPVPYPNNAGAESRAPLFAPPPTFLAAASRGHVHDPTAVVRSMLDDARYDNATLRAVLAEQYPGYNIDALMQGAA